MEKEMIEDTDLTDKDHDWLTFNDVAVHFMEDEWELLTPEDKELHREVMLENYNNVELVGSYLNKPAMIVQLEKKEMTWSPALQRPAMKKKRIPHFCHCCCTCCSLSGDEAVAINQDGNPEQEITEDIGSQRMCSAGVSRANAQGPEFPEGSDCGSDCEGRLELQQKSHKYKEREECQNHKTTLHKNHTGTGAQKFYCLSQDLKQNADQIGEPSGIKRKDKLKSYQCEECGKVFRGKSHFIRHQRIHTGEKPFKCHVCDKAFGQNSGLTKHRRVHTGEKPYKCKDCGKAFRASSGLLKHNTIHTGETPFQCDVCGRKFRGQSNMIEHKRIHDGVKRYSCNDCGKTFIGSSGLIQHKRVHTGEKPFSCGQCGKGFAGKSGLVQHSRIHTGERPFDCSECGKSFRVKSDVNRHKRIHNGIKPYVCDICGEAFRWQTSFNSHQRIHNMKTFTCKKCGKVFKRYSTFIKHVGIFHKDP